VTAYRSSAKLDAASRKRFEVLLEAAARANAEAKWTQALSLVEQALALGESGELLFEAGRAHRGAGRRYEARRSWDAATTLLARELGGEPKRASCDLEGAKHTVWATNSRFWIGDWLYDRASRRLVAYVPADSGTSDVFAAADNWVLQGGTLWNVKTGLRVAEIPGASVAPSPTGEALYVLHQRSLKKYRAVDGTLLRELGQVPRTDSAMRLGGAISTAPPERLLSIADTMANQLFDLQQEVLVQKVDPHAADPRVLAGGWILVALLDRLTALHVASGKSVSYRWREPPNHVGAPIVSRDGSRFIILELVPRETLVFRAPTPGSRKLSIASRFPTVLNPEGEGTLTFLMFAGLSPDGSLASATTGQQHDVVWVVDTNTSERLEIINVADLRGELCRFGARVYPWELCSSRFASDSAR
jgi:hypothetical protein